MPFVVLGLEAARSRRSWRTGLLLSPTLVLLTGSLAFAQVASAQTSRLFTSLSGSTFQGGDGDLDEAQAGLTDWKSYTSATTNVDANALDTEVAGKEFQPYQWTLTTSAGG